MSLAPHIMPNSAHAARPRLQPLPLTADMAHPVPLEFMLPGRPAGGPAGHAEPLRLVRQWLAHRARSASTYQGYRRECERLLLWCAMGSRNLVGLTADDIQEYDGFLADPQPADFWQGPAGPRDRLHWRPFEGALSQPSRRAALRILRALYSFLYRQGHSERNPVADMAAPAGSPVPAAGRARAAWRQPMHWMPSCVGWGSRRMAQAPGRACGRPADAPQRLACQGDRRIALEPAQHGGPCRLDPDRGPQSAAATASARSGNVRGAAYALAGSRPGRRRYPSHCAPVGPLQQPDTQRAAPRPWPARSRPIPAAGWRRCCERCGNSSAAAPPARRGLRRARWSGVAGNEGPGVGGPEGDRLR